MLYAAFAAANVAKGLLEAGAKSQSFNEALVKTAKSFNCNIVSSLCIYYMLLLLLLLLLLLSSSLSLLHFNFVANP